MLDIVVEGVAFISSVVIAWDHSEFTAFEEVGVATLTLFLSVSWTACS